MPNRYYSSINGRLSAPTPPKDERKSGVPSVPTRTKDWHKPSGSVGPKRNAVGFPEVKQYAAQRLADDKGLSKRKAREMLRHGEVHGKPITKKQRGLFALRAAGKKTTKRGA